MPENCHWISGPGIVRCHGAVTREFPFWTVTITGGDLPAAGHMLTSMSYARLDAEATDWIEWHQLGECHGFTDADRYSEYRDASNREFGGDHDDDCLPDGAIDDGEVSVRDGQGVGFTFVFDYDWPAEVVQARERYWAAQDAIKDDREATEEANATLGEPLCTIAEVLMVGEAHVGHIVGLPAEDVEQLMDRHHQLEYLRYSGLTLEDWEAGRHAIEPESET
jgi:hypothetical protein